MADSPVLLLYVGEDFLFPTVFTGGAACPILETSRHFWLYFNTNSRVPDYSHAYKSRVSNRESGYYGCFLEKCALDEQVIIDGSGHPYFDLIRSSRMLEDLRDMFVKYSMTEGDAIETEYVFAESVPDEQRRVFMREMKRNRFVPVSYSVQFSEVVMEYIRHENPGWNPMLGDKTLILNSVQDKLLLTDAVYDGDRWLSDGTCQIIQEFGETPVKDALVRYIIRSIDRQYSFLANEKDFKEEFEFQRTNAEKWIHLPRGGDGSFFVTDFQYKSYGGPHQCLVSDMVLQQESDNALRSVIGTITDFIRSRFGENLVMTVLIGVAFDDESLVERITRGIGSYTNRVITTTLLPKVFSRYQAVFGGVRDDFSHFNDVMDDMRKKRQGVAEWGASAADIRNLRLWIKDAADKLEEASKSDADHYEAMIKLSEGDLVHSAFTTAGKKLEVYPVPSDPVLVAIQKANGLAENARQKQQLFERIGDIPGAKAAVSEIGDQVERINKFILESDGRVKGLRGQRDRITFYESHYDEYRRLKNEFDSMGTPAARRRALREAMIPLTREPLPDLVLRHVRVRLNAEVIQVRRLFSRKKTLIVHLEVLNGDVLPCPAVLNIMEGTPIEPMPDSPTCIRIDIPKGESSFVREFDLSEERRIVEGKTIRMRLFTDEFQLDTDAIKNETGTDNPFFRINQV